MDFEKFLNSVGDMTKERVDIIKQITEESHRLGLEEMEAIALECKKQRDKR